MVELGWSAPATGVDVVTARHVILWQHERIRELLDRAKAIAESALDGDVQCASSITPIIADLHSTLELHLAFEERVLVPLLADGSTAGAERVERMTDQHELQRGELVAIDREACAQPHLPTLAAKLAFLTSSLLADMDEEERSLLLSDIDS